ncbi:hypothetical protein L1049_009365 [Liquidambar formosana]|uniref:Transcription initiation factor TFIID subunit 8 n=1 Tax=Liquidambar formosana TaxID=63359 RepID=A0AAP0S5Y7_LIQFO
MSDGGGADSRRQNQPQQRDDPAARRAGADEFGRAVSKIAVAQVCESVGFQSFEESALEALSDVAVRYLRDLGKTAAFYANLAGRTQCNVFDVVQGLEDLGSSEGFSGASEVGHCAAESGTVRQLVEYVGSAEEVPFAQPVPRFPVIRDRKMVPSFMQMGETPTGKHIPAWLPAFPDQHTYIHTPVWNERATDPRADKIEQARQRRKAERSLLSLQQRLLCNGSAAPSGSAVESGDHVKELQADESNPFLASPFQTGEKDVSPVVLPAKLSSEAVVENHVSVLEAFAPAIEAVKGGISDLVDNEKRALPDKRPAVNFKFGTGKKLLGESLGLSLRNKGVAKPSSWIGRDEERDDKKRRAELILRQSMENPQELTQL